MNILRELNKIARDELSNPYKTRRGLSEKAVEFHKRKYPDCEVKQQKNRLYAVKFLREGK